MGWKDIWPLRLIGSRTERRWLDNPGLQGEGQITMQALLALTAGTPAYSGQVVNERTASNFVPFWACVKVLAESIATLPLIVYERVDTEYGDGKERSTSHPLYRRLHDEPNPYMTAVALKETMQGHLCVWGNAYARLDFDGSYRGAGIWPLDPSQTTPEIRNNELWYTTTYPDGRTETLPDWRVLHIHGLGSDGFVGKSVIQCVKQAVGLGLGAEEFGARLFGQGVMPGMTYSHPGTLSEEALKHLRETIGLVHGGASNAWKPMILEEGMKAESMGVPPEDAQFLETRRFQVEEICRFFRVPPHMVQLMQAATNNNVAQQSLEFVKYTLAIWIRKWEQELNRKLFGGNSRFFCEFLLDDLLRADPVTRWQTYREAWSTGAMSINEIRARENLNPIENGDEYFVPLNFAPLSKLNEEPEPDPVAPVAPKAPAQLPDDVSPDQVQTKSHRALIHDVLTRMLPREGDRLARGKGTEDSIRTKWLEETHAALRPSIEAFMACMGKRGDVNAIVAQYAGIHFAGGGVDVETDKLAKAIMES